MINQLHLSMNFSFIVSIFRKSVWNLLKSDFLFPFWNERDFLRLPIILWEKSFRFEHSYWSVENYQLCYMSWHSNRGYPLKMKLIQFSIWWERKPEQYVPLFYMSNSSSMASIQIWSQLMTPYSIKRNFEQRSEINL